MYHTSMDIRRIVVTGINGFVGQHLARELFKQNITVIGVARDDSVAPEIKDIVAEYYPADLVNEWPVIAKVDAVIHLAGLAAVGPSFDNPQQYLNSNSAMVTNMCEHFMKQEKKPRILVVSSGSVYDSTQPLPITEEGQLGFSSPYSVSKILVENQCAYYRNRGLECIIARPFNHIGPGQGKGFIVPDFYTRIQEAEPTAAIKVGNINTKRDYTDVRDIVKAYTAIVTALTPQYPLYNVCSGKSVPGKEILDKLKQVMQKPNIQFEIDPALVRPTDTMDIYGDSSRLQNEFGWHPTYTLDQTISDFVARASKA